MDQRTIVAECGEGALSVRAVGVPCGPDLSVVITGGTAPHIGAVALGYGVLPGGEKPRYSPAVSTLTLQDHKDDVIARAAAKLLAQELRANVCVSCGIHVDHAGQQELDALQRHADMALQDLLCQLRAEAALQEEEKLPASNTKQ